MNVVSYSEAARMAGVSRQRINGMKIEHDSKKYDRPFFCHNPGNGKPGVDIDHPSWRVYVDSGTGKRVNKKPQSKSTESKDSMVEKDNSDIISIFVDACLSAVKELYNLNDADMKTLRKKIGEIYQENNK